MAGGPFSRPIRHRQSGVPQGALNAPERVRLRFVGIPDNPDTLHKLTKSRLAHKPLEKVLQLSHRAKVLNPNICTRCTLAQGFKEIPLVVSLDDKLDWRLSRIRPGHP